MNHYYIQNHSYKALHSSAIRNMIGPSLIPPGICKVEINLTEDDLSHFSKAYQSCHMAQQNST